MVKKLLLAVFIGCSLSSFSMRKKKQLSMIESCQAIADKNSVFAGTDVSLIMAFFLSNGETVKSNKRARFGFKDFNISVEGSGKSHRKSKRKLSLFSFYNAVNNPFIKVNFQMVEKPDVNYSLSIPIHFKGTYTVNFSARRGETGVCGRTGICGGSSQKRDRQGNGYNGGYAGNGENGSRGYRGRDAGTVKVYVSLIDFPARQSELIKVQCHYENGSSKTRYLDRLGNIKINARGGSGGSGGQGGNGGKGGNGADGLYKRKATDTDKGCQKEGFGGNGGRGGDGGHGGDGGDGGRGGDVYVYFKPDAWFFQNRIVISNFGGGAGRGGSPGCGGKGGNYGRGGAGNGNAGHAGRGGHRGRSGSSGSRGMIYYDSW